MDEFIKKFAAQVAVIRAAPYPHLLAVAVVASTIWFLVNLGYSTVLSNKNSQIDLLQARVNDYQDKLKGASPDQAADEIKRLRAEIESLKNPPRDENSFYQKGRRIGVVYGANVDVRNKLVSFAMLTVAGEIDAAANAEFKDLVLAFSSADGTSQARQGLAVTTTYNNARFAIVGNRN